MKHLYLGIVLLSLTSLLVGSSAQVRCGSITGGSICPNRMSCSRYGVCGRSPAYCGNGCQSNCRPAITSTLSTTACTPSGDISSFVPESLFNEMLKHRTDLACQGGFYTYSAFITAARSFSGFGTTGDTDTRKREISAFFAQTSHETTGGSATAPDGPYAWGYCLIQEKGQNHGDFCKPDLRWPCAPHKKYFGRGPLQISWNFNYGPAGRAIGVDLLNNPGLVTGDPVVSFKTALWFWMTPQPPKPSPHNVITGQWTPSSEDRVARRIPGFGLITNIINGRVECGGAPNEKVANRNGFYRRYCSLLGVDPGYNLDCSYQTPYPS